MKRCCCISACGPQAAVPGVKVEVHTVNSATDIGQTRLTGISCDTFAVLWEMKTWCSFSQITTIWSRLVQPDWAGGGSLSHLFLGNAILNVKVSLTLQLVAGGATSHIFWLAFQGRFLVLVLSVTPPPTPPCNLTFYLQLILVNYPHFTLNWLVFLSTMDTLQAHQTQPQLESCCLVSWRLSVTVAFSCANHKLINKVEVTSPQKRRAWLWPRRSTRLQGRMTFWVGVFSYCPSMWKLRDYQQQDTCFAAERRTDSQITSPPSSWSRTAGASIALQSDSKACKVEHSHRCFPGFAQMEETVFSESTYWLGSRFQC